MIRFQVFGSTSPNDVSTSSAGLRATATFWPTWIDLIFSNRCAAVAVFAAVVPLRRGPLIAPRAANIAARHKHVASHSQREALESRQKTIIPWTGSLPATVCLIVMFCFPAVVLAF